MLAAFLIRQVLMHFLQFLFHEVDNRVEPQQYLYDLKEKEVIGVLLLYVHELMLHNGDELFLRCQQIRIDENVFEKGKSSDVGMVEINRIAVKLDLP